MQVLMNLGLSGLTLGLFSNAFTVRGVLSESNDKRAMLIGMLIPILINSFTEFESSESNPAFCFTRCSSL